MNKCECYKWGERFECRYSEDGRPYGTMVGYNYCSGTKECDACSCSGDRTKCDFYPEVREKALNEIKGIKTNADKIRSMTDEELALFINCGDIWFEICSKCETFDDCQDNAFCTSKTLEWLKTEIK